MRFTKRIGAVLALSALSGAVAGQEIQPARLSPIVISASGLPLTEAALNQHVSVFDRDEIDRETAAGVSEFLTKRTGMVVDRSPRSGGYGSLFLRGADPSHVVVLIDGVRQNDPFSSRGSAVDLNTLTLDDVERIEVVRGNASVAHGEALAGVVQIFTRSPGKRSAMRVGVEAGGHGLRSANAALSNGPWNASLTHREDGERNDEGWSRTRSANIGFRERYGSTRVQAQVRLADGDSFSFPDDSGGERFAVTRTKEQKESKSRQVSLVVDQELSPAGTVELRLADFQRDTKEITPGVAPGVRDPFGLPPIDSESDYDRQQLQAIWRPLTLAGWDLLLGAEAQRETGSLNSRLFLGAWVPADFQIRRNTRSLIAEARTTRGPFSLQMGFRHEHTPGQEDIEHPAFSIQYRLPDAFGRIGAAWSSASKLPSFYALGHPFVGNPSLKPERSRQKELYYASAESSPWKARITAFEADYRDLVDFDAGPPPQLVNRARIESRGVELNVARDWTPGIRTYGQGTIMTVRDPDGGGPLRHRPHKQGSAGLEVRVAPKWLLHSRVSFVGKRFDSSIPTGDAWLVAYATVDVSLAWQGKACGGFVAVDNVLDRDIEETVGTFASERRLRVGVRWSY
jgi:vitamin B12 transporter